MKDLSVSYLGLKLKNPVIVGSCGFTNSVDDIVKLEQNNAAAVVLKSVFEEQIHHESELFIKSGDAKMAPMTKGFDELMKKRSYDYGEAQEYISNFAREHTLNKYLQLITDVKKAVSIPVIASVNCVFTYDWHSFAKRIQDAGADALELNIYILPSDPLRTGTENEEIYLNVINEVKKYVSIPITLKMSYYLSGLSSKLIELSGSGLAGMVLFNRPYSPDIDIDNFTITTGNIYSSPTEYVHTLRWVAILAGRLKCDIAAGTGIHDSDSAIKLLLAGANALQITSAIYSNGLSQINAIVSGIGKWMEKHGFESVEDFRGKMSQVNIEHPAAYERVQFMKLYSKI